MEFCEDRIITLNTDTFFPTRSFTPSDFFLWSHLNNSIYETAVIDFDGLKTRITNNTYEMNITIKILQIVLHSVKRMGLYIEHNSEYYNTSSLIVNK